MKHKCELDGCLKKIKLVETLTNICNCDLLFCSNHKQPECHNCQYDYKSEIAAEIMKNGCPASKLVKI